MYAKIFTQIYDGTLCSKGPWEALVTFQQLLILADKDGCVDMTSSAISRRTTIPQEVIDVGIAALLLADPDSRTPDEEGKRIIPLSDERKWGWRIVNYAHYRNLRDEESRREYHRNYWHTRKDKLNSTQQLNTPQPELDPGSKQEAVSNKQVTTTDHQHVPNLDLAAWSAWVSYRKQIKKPIKSASTRAAQKMLAEFGDTQYAVVQQSIANGYQGLFELKSGSQSNGKNQHTSKPSLAERATNARKEFERSIGIGDTIQATDGELVGAHEPPVRP